MNTIKAAIDVSEYGYSDFLNYRIDDYWLDEQLEELYPDNYYGGTIPTLSFGMEIEKEEKIVWDRIMPDLGKVTNCPILMCPDDNDFSCVLIVAEIENSGKTIMWRRLGIDQTKELEAEKVGTIVKWFDKIQPLEFRRSDYLKMLEDFKKQFEIDKSAWEKRLKEFTKNKNDDLKV